MNFMAFEYWTDGWRDGSLMPNDEGLRQCKCGQYILVRNMVAVETADSSELPYMDHVSNIEAERGVRVLYACESGSRGWGFASPDSDYDVRFIYVHPLPWYLRVSAQRDVIEVPISDELDINGWELRKALGLLKKGNATLIEWLDSPVVYRATAIVGNGRCSVGMGARVAH